MFFKSVAHQALIAQETLGPRAVSCQFLDLFHAISVEFLLCLIARYSPKVAYSNGHDLGYLCHR